MKVQKRVSIEEIERRQNRAKRGEFFAEIARKTFPEANVSILGREVYVSGSNHTKDGLKGRLLVDVELDTISIDCLDDFKYAVDLARDYETRSGEEFVLKRFYLY